MVYHNCRKTLTVEVRRLHAVKLFTLKHTEILEFWKEYNPSIYNITYLTVTHYHPFNSNSTQHHLLNSNPSILFPNTSPLGHKSTAHFICLCTFRCLLTSTIIFTVGNVVAMFWGCGGRTVIGTQPAYRQP